MLLVNDASVFCSSLDRSKGCNQRGAAFIGRACVHIYSLEDLGSCYIYIPLSLFSTALIQRRCVHIFCVPARRMSTRHFLAIHFALFHRKRAAKVSSRWMHVLRRPGKSGHPPARWVKEAQKLLPRRLLRHAALSTNLNAKQSIWYQALFDVQPEYFLITAALMPLIISSLSWAMFSKLRRALKAALSEKRHSHLWLKSVCARAAVVIIMLSATKDSFWSA